MKAVGVPFVKKDAKALVTGKPVYTNDLAPKDCLIVKLLRSPHANAMIQEIKTTTMIATIMSVMCRELKQSIPGRMYRSSVLQLQDRPGRSLVRMTG